MLASRITALADRCAPFTLGRAWPLWAVLAGTAPLALAWPLHTSLHQPFCALALFVLVLPAVRADRTTRGVAIIALAFVAHIACAIALSALDAPASAPVFKDGDAYWVKQLAWIETGVDPEYVASTWTWAHLQLFVGMVALAVLSLGLIPFFQGFYEVDLMDFYVGNLVARSDAVLPALAYGWHPWSIARGVCYAFLVFEVVSWSLERLERRPLSTRARRATRWAVALGFFALDYVLKLTLLDVVRVHLAAHIGVHA